jgi:hypothetical protein
MFSIFHSEIVTLLVGPEKVPLRVHKDLICSKSEFFRACLENGFSEGTNNVVPLPDDDVKTVETFLTFVYYGVFDLQVMPSGDIPEDFCRDYRFGDKILAEAYCNIVIDKLREHLADTGRFLHSGSMLKIHKAGLKATTLGSFVLKGLVYRLLTNTFKDGFWANQMAKFYEDKSIMEAIMNEIFRFRIKSWTDPNTWEGCHFHVHKNGSKCAAMEKVTTTT